MPHQQKHPHNVKSQRQRRQDIIFVAHTHAPTLSGGVLSSSNAGLRRDVTGHTKAKIESQTMVQRRRSVKSNTMHNNLQTLSDEIDFFKAVRCQGIPPNLNSLSLCAQAVMMRQIAVLDTIEASSSQKDLAIK